MKNVTNEPKTKLSNGQKVDQDFFNIIYTAVFERVSVLSPDTKLSMKAICGKDFWNCLSPGEKRRAGWCMVHLVAMRILPFRVAESRHEYPVYYQLE